MKCMKGYFAFNNNQFLTQQLIMYVKKVKFKIEKIDPKFIFKKN